MAYMKRGYFFLGITALSSLLLAGDKKPAAAKPTDEKPCLANFSEEGSFMSGKTYKTFQEFPKMDRGKAIEKMAQTIAGDGWQGMTVNKDVGVITAVQTVSYGNGKQSPLNVVAKNLDSGAVRVEAVFATSGGVKVKTKDIQDEFCKILASAVE
jgi:hypothetical protein